jgi:two-component system, cell cycle response regulator DivK
MAARILLVEDNEMNRDMLRRRLERRGMQIETATDAEQALGLARSLLPDLVLMDISLPGMDGFEATRLLKADPRTCAIPIIALTAHAMAGDRQRCLEVGCDDYDVKPVELARLVSKIELLLGASSSPAQ